MTVTGQLLRILGAAIVLIAVQFMPLPARAHIGHVHGVSAHAAHLHHHAPTASLSAKILAPAMGVMVAGELRAAPQEVQDVAVNCGICVAGCCGAALAATSPTSIPPVARLRDGDLEASIPGRGREPDGLRRPPRSFA